MKVVKITAVVIVVIILCAFVFLEIFLRLPHPSYSGTIDVPGLWAPVEVRFDEFAVPHIFADNEHDLFFAQGYVTARERMFEMDVTRLAGRGELSTLFGDVTIKEDKYLKTVGFYRMARAEYAAMPPWAKEIVAAYTDGVNAYLDTTKHLPREYAILRARPAPWVPEDTVVAGLLMGYSLETSVDADLSFYQIGRLVGDERLRLFLPSFPDFAPTISPDGGTAAVHGAPSPTALFGPSTGRAGGRPFGLGVPGITGSNWMIFAPKVTTTGSAIFTGSPDLAPQIPAIFYLVHLVGGGYNVIGGSVPGTPGVASLGFNGHIAWSAIASQVDCLDFFVEKTDPKDPNSYLTEDGYRTFETIDETLRIKDGGGIREEKITVKVSRHGPIISGVDDRAPENCALSWTGSGGSGALEGFLALDRARDFQEFRKALSGVAQPELVIGYADKDGNIGYQSIAKAPIRKGGDGMLPAPGWDGRSDWVGFVPYDELPFDYDPTAGYLGGFNNLARRADYGLSNFYYFERATRFHEIMKERTAPIGPEDAEKLQLDTVSVVAERLVPYLTAAATDEKLRPYLALFDGWDFDLNKESAAAALYGSFYRHLLTDTFSDEFPEEIWKELTEADMVYFADQVLAKHIGENDFPLFDDLATKDKVETRDDILIKSIAEAVEELSRRLGDDPKNWRWGELHPMTFAHPLGEALPFLNLRPIPMGGDFFTIGAANWDNNDPYRMTSGGCIRMIVDFSDVERSTLMSPPGQSGHYLSPHYDDLAKRWAQNDQIPMHYGTARELEDVLILQPAK